MRTLVLWCPDWPVTALGYGADEPVIIIDGLVVAASRTARLCGVRVGMRRREAERHCPQVITVRRDETKEVEEFAAVFAALVATGPSVELLRPGLCALIPRGPARYFGGEGSFCQHLASIVQQVIPQLNAPEVGIGIADGVFAATLAAHRQRVVPRGKTRNFLAPLPITTLDHRELTDMLITLGIYTLGDFAALPQEMVTSRFGVTGALAYRKASGDEQTTLYATPPPEDFDVRIELELPVDRVDVALFATRAPATTLITTLARRGLGCSRLSIEIETEHGEVLYRRWRADYLFDADAVIQRLRWQLDGWLSKTTTEPAPTAGIVVIRLHPDEVLLATGQQSSLFGGNTDLDRRAIAGADRLVGLFGRDTVFTGAVGGGRSPGDRSVLVPWGKTDPKLSDAPWPGRHPVPAPSVIYRSPLPLVVTGKQGLPVVVNTRGKISFPPAIAELGAVRHTVTAWSGPWLSDERFWDVATRRRCARFQLLFDDGTAHLCFVEQAKWFVEATYD